MGTSHSVERPRNLVPSKFLEEEKRKQQPDSEEVSFEPREFSTPKKGTGSSRRMFGSPSHLSSRSFHPRAVRSALEPLPDDPSTHK